MKAKEFIPASKPRNFVAKNQKTAGAGQHKDKKKAEKQGNIKHKKELVPMDEERTEVKDKDGKVTSWKDEGEWKKSTAKKDSRGKVTNLSDKARRETEKLSKKEKEVSMEARDPKDWDEGNTEPPNNFAVYINGKKWKVIKGRGQFADDYKERDHLRQLNSMAQQKSLATGKKWTIAVTGEPATESIAEKAPPGFKGTVKAMKKHKDIDNPFALAWSMKNKGHKSHKKADGSDK